MYLSHCKNSVTYFIVILNLSFRTTGSHKKTLGEGKIGGVKKGTGGTDTWKPASSISEGRSLETKQNIPRNKRHTCCMCNKSFTCAAHLNRHVITHRVEKPYTCSTCGKNFTEAENLRRHMRIHTGERPHTCSTCGKSFTTTGDLKKHMRIHTGEKPYLCSTCGKRFTEAGNLKAHMRIHTEYISYL